jgi:predicted lactoylglutathione lyase
MTKDFWINLPVKDLKRSKEFFTSIGFTFKGGPGDTEFSACMILGERKTAVMLFAEPVFKGFTSSPIADTSKGTEVLLSIDAESREEVDDITEKALKAGGTVFGRPGGKDGWMYGSGFTDLDGHRWNVLYMDMSQMPKG